MVSKAGHLVQLENLMKNASVNFIRDIKKIQGRFWYEKDHVARFGRAGERAYD